MFYNTKSVFWNKNPVTREYFALAKKGFISFKLYSYLKQEEIKAQRKENKALEKAEKEIKKEIEKEEEDDKDDQKDI